MARHCRAEVPADLRGRLEVARLDLLSLFRALDRLNLAPAEIPQRLIRQLFALDADYAEALWALDQPPGTLNMTAMLGDTLAALEQLPEASHRLRKNLPPRTPSTLVSPAGGSCGSPESLALGSLQHGSRTRSPQ